MSILGIKYNKGDNKLKQVERGCEWFINGGRKRVIDRKDFVNAVRGFVSLI